MQIIVERIDNPNHEFWIWNKKITNKQDGRIYPSTISNVGSGKSVAIYQSDDNNSVTQIAQLQLPDYEKLFEYYSTGKQVNLNYTYIDDFAWLGDKKPYEVEDLPYENRKGLSAQCAVFNYFGEKTYVHIMQSEIKDGDINFSYAGFFNLNLDLCNLSIKQGNLVFSSARFYQTNISLGTIICEGNPLFPPEISFRYITADTAKIDVMLMSKKLSVDFLCAKTNNTTISLDPLPTTFNEICLTRATVDEVKLTNAEIDSLDIRDAHINFLEFKRCKFGGLSEIAGDIQELHVDDCLNQNVFKLSLSQIENLTFFGTINNGKFCFTDFTPAIRAISKLYTISTCDAGQFLMLKENFRQTGEYENEDICHLHFQRLRTKREKNVLKKLGRYTLDVISGYGTEPFRMLLVILVIIVLFGTLYYFVPFFSYHGVNTWLEHVYASGITFFAVGYGDLFPLNIVTKMVSLTEAFLGVTATSYFLVLLSRKVIR